MHLFFDTVWKLHIGEIPEKPHEFIDEIEQYDIWEEYRNKIAAIKQNALMVGNPEFLESHFWCGKFEHLNLIEIPPPPDKFYFWPGGYYVDMWNAAPRDEPSEPDEVAILTLPEEKKNTMENMTKEQAIDFLREYAKCGIHHNYMDPQDKLKKMDECIVILTASGSVAAPKEEELTAQVELIAWCFYGIGAVGWDMNPHIRWEVAWDKFKETGQLPNSEWKNRRFREVSNCNLLSELASLRQQLEGMKSILKEIEFQVYAEGWSPQERLAEIKKKFPKR